MESLKAPSPTALAAGALVVIWTEVSRKRVSFWVAVKDTMSVMETRRVAVAQQKKNAGITPPSPAAADPEFSEARAFYERTRGPKRRPTFTDS